MSRRSPFAPSRPRRFIERLVRLCALSWLLTTLYTCTQSGSAFAKPKVHVVYAGQRLGSIAKRYNVTVDELCAANGISRNSTIKPGQKLIIPGTDDGTGPQSESTTKSKSSDNKKSDDKTKTESDKKSDDKAKGDAIPEKPTGKATIHVVAKGHTLGAISGRYAVTVAAICTANGITPQTSLSVGQRLVIPHKSDKTGEYANKQRLRGHFDEDIAEPEEKNSDKGTEKNSDKSSAKSGKSWKPYLKPAWRRGYIKIRRWERSWEGYVIDPNNKVLGHASNKINFVMGAKANGPQIDPSLIRLIASVSDAFGGRELHIVSGYRTKSFVAASKHKEGKALDFSIPGVPNEALRDYLRTIHGVGVGYYPNSSFVHLDVRGYNSYWVDYAGPGEAPRKGKKSTAKKEKSKDAASEDPHEEESAEEAPGDDEGPTEENGEEGATEPPPPEDDSTPPAEKKEDE